MRLAWRGACLSALALAASSGPALAHLVTTGLGPVYDGIGHLFLTPLDLLPAVGVALYAGLRGPKGGRQVLFVLPAGWFAGGVIGMFLPLDPAGLFAPAISLMLVGALVAADLRVSPSLVTVLAALIGLLHGAFNGAAMATEGRGSLELIGIAAALFVIAALTAALVIALRPPWTRIAVRVLGSWIAAIGLLTLGWSLRASA